MSVEDTPSTAPPAVATPATEAPVHVEASPAPESEGASAVNPGYEGAFYDGSLRFSDRVLHFFPVFIALFTLTVSVARYSIDWGFNEKQPNTYLSVVLMLLVMVVLAAAVRNRALPPIKRRAAGILTLVTGFAVLDERNTWHEDVGYWVQDNLTIFNEDIRHYTDDILVTVFAIVGGILLFLFVRKLPDRRTYVPYVIAVVVVALAHGIFDIFAHGGRIWLALDPDLSKGEIRVITYTISFYEESCKIWAEWLVLLFALRFFYNQKGPLRWTLFLLLGSFAAGMGLWAVPDSAAGVPYIKMDRSFRFLRNYHYLLTLGLIYITYSVAAWRITRRDPAKQAFAGLFFIVPFYPYLPEMTDVVMNLGSATAQEPGALGVTVVVLGLIVGALGFAAVRLPKPGRLALGGAVLAAGLASFSMEGFEGQLLRVAAVSGAIVPALLILAVRAEPDKQQAMRVVGVGVVAATAVQNPLWLVAAVGAFILWRAARRDEDAERSSRLAVTGIFVAHLIVFGAVYSISKPGILTAYRFKIPETVMFETGIQEIPEEYYITGPGKPWLWWASDDDQGVAE